MLTPSAMFIEAAADSVKSLDPRIVEDQQRELDAFGAARLQALGITGLTDDVRLTYTLALQVARAMLATSPALLMKGIDPAQVL